MSSQEGIEFAGLVHSACEAVAGRAARLSAMAIYAVLSKIGQFKGTVAVDGKHCRNMHTAVGTLDGISLRSTNSLCSASSLSSSASQLLPYFFLLSPSSGSVFEHVPGFNAEMTATLQELHKPKTEGGDMICGLKVM